MASCVRRVPRGYGVVLQEELDALELEEEAAAVVAAAELEEEAERGVDGARRVAPVAQVVAELLDERVHDGGEVAERHDVEEMRGGARGGGEVGQPREAVDGVGELRGEAASESAARLHLAEDAEEGEQRELEAQVGPRGGVLQEEPREKRRCACGSRGCG